MGLDQYLSKKTYVQNWDHQAPENRHVITISGPRAGIKPERISYIVEEVAYWRKANAIHRWFVKHVQDGEDDCGTYDVTREDLEALLRDVNTVLETSELVPFHDRPAGCMKPVLPKPEAMSSPMLKYVAPIRDDSRAKEVLPTEDGFFFGSIDYDEIYVSKLEYTREVLTKLLAEDDGHADYEYHSSW